MEGGVGRPPQCGRLAPLALAHHEMNSGVRGQTSTSTRPLSDHTSGLHGAREAPLNLPYPARTSPDRGSCRTQRLAPELRNDAAPHPCALSSYDDARRTRGRRPGSVSVRRGYDHAKRASEVGCLHANRRGHCAGEIATPVAARVAELPLVGVCNRLQTRPVACGRVDELADYRPTEDLRHGRVRRATRPDDRSHVRVRGGRAAHVGRLPMSLVVTK